MVALGRKQRLTGEKASKLLIDQQEFEHHLFPDAKLLDQLEKSGADMIAERKRHEIKERANASRKQAEAKEEDIPVAKKAIDPAERERRKKKYLENQIPYLYDNKQSHPIIEYKPSREEVDSSAITPSFVLEVTWPRVVLFYHSSSVHCKEFQSTYVSIARGIKHLSSRLPVEFHAVNCAKYREVCEYGFSVKTVPILMGLKSGRIDWSEIELSEDLAENEMVQFVADAVDIELDEVVGDSLAADVEPEQNEQNESNEEHMARSIANSLLYQQNKLSFTNAAPLVPKSDQVFHDAMSSFVVTLTSSLYSQLPHGSTLPPDRSIAIREFIDLIRWAFPPETPLNELAQKLADEFFTISSSEAGLLKIVGQHINIENGMTWSTRCSGADNSQDGYSCGLWSLLHIISLGVAERHDAVVGDVDRLSVSYAGNVMRSFIDQFFVHCETCRQLWIDLYDEACCPLHNSDHSIAGRENSDATSEDQDWRQLAFTVWEVHNEITVRTKNAAGKGYYSKYSHIASTKLLWPSPNECPKCWQGNTKSANGMINMNSYDRDVVYRFLKQTYWSKGIHNNRHVLLDKWTKTRRHLSMMHLRGKMKKNASSLTINAILLAVCLIWLAVVRYNHYMNRTRRRKGKGSQHNGEGINALHRSRQFPSRNSKQSKGEMSYDGFRAQHATRRSNGRSRYEGNGFGSRHYQL
jgi:hypothetical protein